MELAAALKDSAAVLMRAHGDAVVGAGIEQAILRTIQLAFLGELAHMAVAHGEPLYMTEEELATFSADQAFPGTPVGILFKPGARARFALTAKQLTSSHPTVIGGPATARN